MVLRDSDIDKWEYKEHTKVKHEILTKYLDGWTKILSSTNERLLYFDCFAGRGEYKEGHLGSPILIMMEAQKYASKGWEFICIAVEKDKTNFDNLKKVYDREKHRFPDVKFKPVHGTFEKCVDEISDYLEKERSNIAPSFFFIDPFGFGGAPFKLVKKILSYQHTEILVTFMSRDISRFFESAPHVKAIEELFGAKVDLKDFPVDITSRQDALVELYRKQLAHDAKAKFTCAYKLSQTDARKSIYHLIHATNHFKGLKLMKDITYSQGAAGMFTYFGPDERKFGKDQMRLDEFKTPEFQQFLLKRFAGKTISFWDIMEETYTETPYIEKHYRSALKDLRDRNIVGFKPIKPRPRGGLDYSDKLVFQAR